MTKHYMNRSLLLLMAGMAVLTCEARMPRWAIPPEYEVIGVKVHEKLLQTEAGGKMTLWSMADGSPVYTTEHTIMQFRDGVATLIPQGSDKIKGFVDMEGKFTSLPDVQMTYDSPVFRNGYLLGLEKSGFSYFKTDGSKADFPAVHRAYPFHRGYAVYMTYDQPDKRKDPCYGYFRADGEPMTYQYRQEDKVKEAEPKWVVFLSSIGANGKGVAVIKGKLYWYEPQENMFEPMLWGNGDSEKKRHLSLAMDYDQYFEALPYDSIEFSAKYGKSGYAILKFDRELRPARIKFDDYEMEFSEAEEKPGTYMTSLSKTGKDRFGLAMKGEEMLPPQFEQIDLMYDNKAFVKKDGKWGLIEIDPNLDYTLKLNKGDDVGFRHQKFETQIRLDLPPVISAKEAHIDISEDTGCQIDKTSRETKDTESGNFVTYDCVLNIPDSLPDVVTDMTYNPVRLSYDGLMLPDMPLTIKAWHRKSYNVDPIDSETSISGGVASFTVNVNNDKNAGEGDYYFDVWIEAEAGNVSYEKISETRYKFEVSDLKEGSNSLNIMVKEKGCPASVFPFEIYYSKPVPKTKKKEEVKIIKKDRNAPKPVVPAQPAAPQLPV